MELGSVQGRLRVGWLLVPTFPRATNMIHVLSRVFKCCLLSSSPRKATVLEAQLFSGDTRTSRIMCRGAVSCRSFFC